MAPLLNNHEVIYDESSINDGDEVKFVWNSKIMHGIVLVFSGKFLLVVFITKMQA